MPKRGCQDIVWTGIKDMPKAAVTEVSSLIAIWLQQTRDDVNDTIDYTLLMLTLMVLGFVMGYCCYDRPPKFIRKTMIPMAMAGIGMALIYHSHWGVGELEMIQSRRIDFNADPVSDTMVSLKYFGITFSILEFCRVMLHVLAHSSCSKSSVKDTVVPKLAVVSDPAEPFLTASNQVEEKSRPPARGRSRRFNRRGASFKRDQQGGARLAGFGLQSTSTSGTDADPDPADIRNLYRLHDLPTPASPKSEVIEQKKQLTIEVDNGDEDSARSVSP